MKRKKKNSGAVQGHALLYGRSSRAIRIVNGVEIGKVNNQQRSSKKQCVNKKQTQQVQQVQVRKNYKMDKNIEKKLDNLQDPLAKMSKYTRAQKYEAAKSSEEYEYGLSDW